MTASGSYSAFLEAFFAAFFGAAFFGAVLTASFLAAFFFFGLLTPVEPIWILPRLDLLSPFPIMNDLDLCKSKKLSLRNKQSVCALSHFSHTGPMIDQKNTFKKIERLCSRKQIELLFESGKSFNSYPIKAVFMLASSNTGFPAQSMFVVPKRNFKRSPDRNKLKRRMREAFRLNKNDFYSRLNETGKNICVAFIYTGRKAENYFVSEMAIKKLLNQISEAK
jgi:ribonuclease P protein component